MSATKHDTAIASHQAKLVAWKRAYNEDRICIQQIFDAGLKGTLSWRSAMEITGFTSIKEIEAASIAEAVTH